MIESVVTETRVNTERSNTDRSNTERSNTERSNTEIETDGPRVFRYVGDWNSSENGNVNGNED